MRESNQNPTIGVCIPTRGTIFTQMLASVLGNLKGYDYEIFTTDNMPIPDCRNYLVEQAKGFQYLWWVDDDIVPPEHWLDEAISLDKDIVSCDSPQVIGVNIRAGLGDKYTGFGCVLMKKSVIDGMDKPHFDVGYDFTTSGYMIKDNNPDWGGEDTYFSHKAGEAGFKITWHGLAKHLRIRNHGEHNSNAGIHEIYELT